MPKIQPPNPKHLGKLAASLFAEPEHREAFLAAVARGQAAKPAIIWLDEPALPRPLPTETPLSWQPSFVDRLAPEAGPAGRHPLHESGAYYSLDFSSVFSASAVLAAGSPATVLDLCAAPGGKGIFAWRALGPELIVSNEVIGKRTGALISNLERCRIAPAAVTRLDPAQLADRAPQAFDLVIADAPCSGQSLVLRGIEAPGAFNPLVVNANANRQKRILASASACLVPGGYLAYMTCTYSREENEDVIRWLLKKEPAFVPVAVPHLAGFQSSLADFPAYRLFPENGLGAGAFVTLLRNQTEGKDRRLSLDDLSPIWQSPE